MLVKTLSAESISISELMRSPRIGRNQMPNRAPWSLISTVCRPVEKAVVWQIPLRERGAAAAGGQRRVKGRKDGIGAV